MLRSSLASLIVDVNLRRTLRPCAPFSFPAHLNHSSHYVSTSHTSLRFPIQRSRHHLTCFYSSYSSSSEKRQPSARNSFNGVDNSSPESSSKILTLPTVLTIGRVAAVPLLVASTLLCLFLDSNLSLESFHELNFIVFKCQNLFFFF